jgi:hypothetical protein
MRRLLGYGAAIGISVVAVMAGSLAAYASTGGFIHSGGGNVNLRAGPGTDYAIVGTIAQNTAVSIDCIGYGTAVSGPFGTTTVWDEIGNGHWVTDAFVDTGTNAPIAMPCATVPALGPGSGSVTASVLAGCGSSGSGSNYGGTTTGPDWWLANAGDCLNGYAYTYGNGPNPSGKDFATWGYYPGAYATCDITLHIPRHYSTTEPPFTRYAHYDFYTNHGGSTLLGDSLIDQADNQTQNVDLGTWQADGSGYLRVQMDDSSNTGGTSQIVAANSATFSCTSKY